MYDREWDKLALQRETHWRITNPLLNKRYIYYTIPLMSTDSLRRLKPQSERISKKHGSLQPLPPANLDKVAPLKLTKKQLRYTMNFYDPNSDTFGNSYQSALNAGFNKVYAAQLASPARQTQWVLEARKRMTHFTPDHIYQALQDVAQAGAPRDKLKALELMGKAKGMFIDRSQQDVHVTFTNTVPRPASEVIDVNEG